MEENVESEIEKRVGVKVNQLMKEVDQIIAFLTALSEDVGLRINKLFAQVDNIVVPLTNTVLKMEEAADHLTTFREATQTSLESIKLLESAAKDATSQIQSFKTPDLGEAANQVSVIRAEGDKALESIRGLTQSIRQIGGGQAPGMPSGTSEDLLAIREESQKAIEAVRSVQESSRKVTEATREIASIRETVDDLSRKTKQIMQDMQTGREPTPRETPPARAQPPEPSAAPSPRSRPSPPPERETFPSLSSTPSTPSQPLTRGGASAVSRTYTSSTVDQMFSPIEDAVNLNAGAIAKAILDVRDKIMTTTRKFGAIYELASVARELAKYPDRPLDRRSKDAVLEKVAGWKVKLSDAISKS